MKRAVKITLRVVLGLVVVGAVAFWWMTDLNRDPNELDVGAAAPVVELLAPDGAPFSLTALADEGFPVLVFYRGQW